MNTPRSQAPSGPIHMVDLQGLHARLRPELDRAMDEVLQESAFIRGRHVSAFEAKLSATLQLDAHVVGCGNGTDALYLALRALGVGPGDEVIVPDFSFIATAEVVAEVGATPVFADIDPRTFNLDPASAERARSARTKAVIVVHLFGQCADMDALVPWAQTHGLHLVEDNAQSLGSVYRGVNVHGPAGTLGDVGCTSFFPSKNLGALGDGGAVMARNADLAARARLVANHGAERKYHHLEVGINSRLDGLQAAFLNVKLDHYHDLIARRQAAADRYDAMLAGSAVGNTSPRPPLVARVPPILRDVAGRLRPLGRPKRPESAGHSHGRVLSRCALGPARDGPIGASCRRWDPGVAGRGGSDFGLADAHRIDRGHPSLCG